MRLPTRIAKVPSIGKPAQVRQQHVEVDQAPVQVASGCPLSV